MYGVQKNYYNKRLYKINNFNKLIINLTYLLRYYLNIEFNFFLKTYLTNLIKTKKYDIWHFHSVNFKTLIISQILKELNQKVVFTFQGADIQLKRKIKYGYRLDVKYDRLLKKNLKKIDRIHSISEEIEKELLQLNFPQKNSKNSNCIKLKKFKKFKIKNQSILH